MAMATGCEEGRHYKRTPDGDIEGCLAEGRYCKYAHGDDQDTDSDENGWEGECCLPLYCCPVDPDKREKGSICKLYKDDEQSTQ